MVKKPTLTKRDLDRERNRLAKRWWKKQKSRARQITPKQQEKLLVESIAMAKQYRDEQDSLAREMTPEQKKTWHGFRDDMA